MPTKKLAGLAAAGGLIAAVAWDDKLRLGSAASGVFSASVALGGQPKGLAVSAAAPSLRCVATGSAVLIVNGSSIASSTAVPWGPTCIAVAFPAGSAAEGLVAVGGTDKRVHLFKLNAASGALTEAGVTKEAAAAISAVAISPDGSSLAAGDAGREIRLFATASCEATVSGKWVAHTTRISGLRWSPSGAFLASVSTDRRLCIWDPKADFPKVTMDLAHAQPFVGVAWASDSVLWTVGADGVASRRELALSERGG